MPFEAKVLTVSDGVTAGTRIDTSGESLVNRLEEIGYHVVAHEVVSDGAESVAEALRSMSEKFSGLILTTGGTGFSPRDETPEGTSSILERFAPGISEAMRLISPLGRLSRGVSGIRGQCIVINLPGSPRGALESLGAVEDMLEHALALLLDFNTHHPDSKMHH